MRRAVLSLAAVALTIPVLFGVVRGSYSLETAAVRVGVLAVAVPVVDQVVGLLLRVTESLMNQPGRGETDDDVPQPARAAFEVARIGAARPGSPESGR